MIEDFWALLPGMALFAVVGLAKGIGWLRANRPCPRCERRWMPRAQSACGECLLEDFREERAKRRRVARWR